MGDVGDYWNAHREFKRAARSLWVECDSPGCQFGGNPVKVPPGEPCRHCGVAAPGERGSDVRHARRDEVRREMDAEKEAAHRAHRQRLRTCPQCGKGLKNEQARLQHEKDKHGTKNGAPIDGPKVKQESPLLPINVEVPF